jgi:hypothetical protein
VTRRRAVAYLLGAILPIGLLALALIPPIALWPRLPEPVGDHWDVTGTANGAHPKAVAFGLAAGFTLAGAVLSGSWAHFSLRAAGEPGRHRVVTGVGALVVGLVLAGVGPAVSLTVTSANLGVRTWHDARPGLWHLAVLAVAPCALAAAGTLLARWAGLVASAVAPDAGGGSRLGLADTERAFWLAGARSPWAGPLALVLLCGAVALAAAREWPPAVVLLVVSSAFHGLRSVTVTASAAGVTVQYGSLRRPVTRFALRRIAGAEAVELTPASWGYRGSLRLFGAAAVVIRKGPALRLRLDGGATFLVTVDDAATGAALINDEIARRAPAE